MNSFSDMMPSRSRFVQGDFFVEGGFTLHRLKRESVGDLERLDCTLETRNGTVEFAILGGCLYLADWVRYELNPGLAYRAEIKQPVIEMHFQLDGGVEAPVNTVFEDYTLREGEANIVYMPEGSMEVTLDLGLTGSVFEIQLAPDYMTGLAERCPELFESYVNRMERSEPFLFAPHSLRITPAMTAIFERIRRFGSDRGAGSLFLESGILELLALLFEQVRPVNGHTHSRSDAERVYAARDLLIERMANPPSLADLARHVGTNEYKLKRCFKEVFGMSPYAYLLEHKLETVRTYLIKTDWSIAEIAYHVGYSDPAHLTHAFRKRYGVTPRELR